MDAFKIFHLALGVLTLLGCKIPKFINTQTISKSNLTSTLQHEGLWKCSKMPTHADR